MGFEIQKAGFWKRAAAFLLDAVLLSIAIAGLLSLLSSLTGYDRKAEQMQQKYDAYSEQYGISLGQSEEAYNALSEADQEKYIAAYNALTSDEEALAIYREVMRLSLLCISLSIFIAFALLEFLIPLLLKEGRTLGKKLFGLCVVHTNCVRLETGALFVRTFLGKFTVETMIPVLVLMLLYYGAIGFPGMMLLLVLLLAQLILLIATQYGQPIHDLFAKSAVADYQSQPIYDTAEALDAARSKKAAEAARFVHQD